MIELPPQQISGLFAVYKEHERILRSDAHPHGEDFLRRKMRELDWLIEGTEHRWDLTVIDDGCPEGSGALAQSIIREAGADDRARVLVLEEAVAAGHPLTTNMKDASASQKGGSILYGMYEAA